VKTFTHECAEKQLSSKNAHAFSSGESGKKKGGKPLTAYVGDREFRRGLPPEFVDCVRKRS
jgi:hypothetical protein